MPSILKSVIFAACFIACTLGAAHGIAALPEALRGGGFGSLHTAEELLFEILNGDIN
jgi:hypothetical protein